ncbi:MAG: hypothetical protein AB9Q19_03510 [Candidatus Reddybacter sp.]
MQATGQQQPNMPPRAYSLTRTASSTCHTDTLLEQYNDASCHFMRCHSENTLKIPSINNIRSLHCGGWLLEGTSTSYWLPQLPVSRNLDAHGHILNQGSASLSSLALTQHGLELTLTPEPGHVIDTVLWKLSPQLLDELTKLAPIETQSYFLWGSHTLYQKPADLYLHLIHGWVYENRTSWPNHWKICSENDAHSLHVLFSGLERATGKQIYSLFKQQLLLSILHRQSNDGGWYHGEWTDDFESHFRLHTSALHLLTDAYTEKPCPIIRESLERGLNFLAERADRVDKGLWFLHDSLEMSEQSMTKSPFKWLPSEAFGKSRSNMLVLNTQWDSTVVFDRAGHQLKNQQWIENASSANNATNDVLSTKPVEWLYKIAFKLISLSFIPTRSAAALPAWQRVLKRIGWKYLIPRFHQLKTFFPRVIMPGGFLDRALSLKGVSTAYQAINVMDLVRLQKRFPEMELRTYIDQAVNFTYESGMWEQWAENPKASYAYGFWAESLYHLCLLDDSFIYRQRLAETMLRMEHLSLGQVPSLLGANHEVVDPLVHQSLTSTLPTGLRSADFSTSRAHEILLLNCTETDSNFSPVAFAEEFTWLDQNKNLLPVGEQILKPGHWLLGTRQNC